VTQHRYSTCTHPQRIKSNEERDDAGDLDQALWISKKEAEDRSRAEELEKKTIKAAVEASKQEDTDLEYAAALKLSRRESKRHRKMLAQQEQEDIDCSLRDIKVYEALHAAAPRGKGSAASAGSSCASAASAVSEQEDARNGSCGDFSRKLPQRCFRFCIRSPCAFRRAVLQEKLGGRFDRRSGMPSWDHLSPSWGVLGGS
jgi:hypothetical protein